MKDYFYIFGIIIFLVISYVFPFMHTIYDQPKSFWISTRCLNGSRSLVKCCKRIPKWTHGYLPNPENCSTYFKCNRHRVELKKCSYNYLWNGLQQKCTKPEFTPCRIDLNLSTIKDIKTQTTDRFDTVDNSNDKHKGGVEENKKEHERVSNIESDKHEEQDEKQLGGNNESLGLNREHVKKLEKEDKNRSEKEIEKKIERNDEKRLEKDKMVPERVGMTGFKRKYEKGLETADNERLKRKNTTEFQKEGDKQIEKGINGTLERMDMSVFEREIEEGMRNVEKVDKGDEKRFERKNEEGELEKNEERIQNRSKNNGIIRGGQKELKNENVTGIPSGGKELKGGNGKRLMMQDEEELRGRDTILGGIKTTLDQKKNGKEHQRGDEKRYEIGEDTRFETGNENGFIKEHEIERKKQEESKLMNKMESKKGNEELKKDDQEHPEEKKTEMTPKQKSNEQNFTNDNHKIEMVKIELQNKSEDNHTDGRTKEESDETMDLEIIGCGCNEPVSIDFIQPNLGYGEITIERDYTVKNGENGGKNEEGWNDYEKIELADIDCNCGESRINNGCGGKTEETNDKLKEGKQNQTRRGCCGENEMKDNDPKKNDTKKLNTPSEITGGKPVGLSNKVEIKELEENRKNANVTVENGGNRNENNRTNGFQMGYDRIGEKKTKKTNPIVDKNESKSIGMEGTVMIKNLDEKIMGENEEMTTRGNEDMTTKEESVPIERIKEEHKSSRIEVQRRDFSVDENDSMEIDDDMNEGNARKETNEERRKTIEKERDNLNSSPNIPSENQKFEASQTVTVQVPILGDDSLKNEPVWGTLKEEFSPNLLNESCLEGLINPFVCCSCVPNWANITLKYPPVKHFYIQCEHQVPVLRQCPEGSFWNLTIRHCG